MKSTVTSLLIGAVIGTVFGLVAVESREPMQVAAVTVVDAPTAVVDTPTDTPTVRVITDGERDLLAAIVYAEANGQDVEGMRYVVDVILNRVDSDKFPGDITGVIFQKGQFWTKGLPAKFSDIPAECYEAVDLAIEETLNTEILYFRNNHYHSFGTPVFEYANHYFSK